MTQEAEAFVRAALAAQLPLQGWSAAIVSLGNGEVTLSCPIAEPLTTAGTGVVMGGIVATLADVAAGLSIISALDPPRPVTTIDFSVHSIAPAKGDRLEAVGQRLKAGRSIAIASAQVFAVDGHNRRLCATLTATFAVAP
jgi:uncharacterized protein (TIGR00369 family)